MVMEVDRTRRGGVIPGRLGGTVFGTISSLGLSQKHAV